MKLGFILFTALRYFKARRRNRGFISSLLSIVGVAIGLLVLITVMSAMNGLQLNYINNLLEISSYHLQITSSDGRSLDRAALERIAALPEVAALVPFREFQAIFDRRAERSETMWGTVRAVDHQAGRRDESFIRHLFGEKYKRNEFDKMQGDFLIEAPGSVMVGFLLAQYLGVQEGSEIVLSSIDQLDFSPSGGEQATSRRLRVSSIFKSGYKDIDEYYLFISLPNSAPFFPAAKSFPLQYGVKLKNRFQDLSVKARVESLLPGAGFTVKTWRDFNKSYFGALLMEKVSIMLLVGLIFIVVGFNIYNSLRRIVHEKYEEIALLKAIGASPAAVRTVFIFEGLLISLVGGIIGVGVGLFVATRIDALLNGFADAVNALFRFLEQALSAFGGRVVLGTVESPFSPRIYYLREAPSIVIPEEVAFMFLFAVLSTAAAAWLASKKISEVKPSEVLRYE